MIFWAIIGIVVFVMIMLHVAQKQLRKKLAHEWWTADENIGDVAVTESGVVLRGPRMTVIDGVCRRSWVYALIFFVFFLTFGLMAVVSIFEDPSSLLHIEAAIVFCVFVVGFFASMANLVIAIRLDNLMSVVGSPAVGGIHFDWGQDAAQPEAQTQHEEQPAADTLDFELRLPDDEDEEVAA